MNKQFKVFKKYIGIGIVLLVTVSFGLQALGSENLKSYEHEELGFSLSYPDEWKMVEHPSDGYMAVSFYDEVAQRQDSRIPDLIQGAKIQVSVRDFKSIEGATDLKNYILERNTDIAGMPEEKFIEINNSSLFIDGWGMTNVVLDKHDFNDSRNMRASFIGKDQRLYTIAMVQPNFADGSIQERESRERVFDNLLKSFTIISQENE